MSENKNANVNVNVNANANAKRRGSGRLKRLVNRKGWLKDEDSSDENRSCSKKEIACAAWKKNKLVKENNVSVKEPKQGKRRGEEKLVKASFLKIRRTFLQYLSLLPIPGGHSRGMLKI